MSYDTETREDGQRLLTGGDDANRGRRRWLIIALVAVAVIAAIAWFAGGSDDGAKTKNARGAQLPNVTVLIPGRTDAERTISATGTLAARRELPVGVAGEGGMVTRVLVEPGQWVQAGQVLALVDRSVQVQSAAGLAAQINVARADAALAQQELDRANSLVDRGFVSKADVQRRIAARDSALARVKTAQAQSSEQRARNARLDIRAPAAGLVLTRGVEPGQIVSSGSGVLFRMAQGGQLELRAQLAESDLATIRPGARATVTPVGETRQFAGEVWQVAPIIDPQTRQGIARIALAYDPALRPGGFASATLTGGSSQVPQLPQSAIQSDEQGNYVYVVGAGDKVAKRRITLGEIGERTVAIATGLTGTERVVASAGAFLNDGQQIKPVLQRTAAN